MLFVKRKMSICITTDMAIIRAFDMLLVYFMAHNFRLYLLLDVGLLHLYNKHKEYRWKIKKVFIFAH